MSEFVRFRSVMNSILDLIRRSKLILVLGIAVVYICFYVALSTNDGETQRTPGEGKKPELSDLDPDPETAAAGSSRPDESEADLLEKEYQTFNVPVLSISSLGKILMEDLGLHLEIPDSARSLQLEALESGGRPLGEILVGLLSPHDLVFHRQGKLLRIVEGKYKRQTRPGADEKEAFRSCSVETAIRVKWAEPVDLWIDSVPPLKLRIAIQPLYEESEVRRVLLTVAGRREQHLWFRQVLDAPLGELSRIETKGSEWIWLTLKPMEIDETDITLEVKFNHEFSQPLP